jgi:hypothetical protein
MKGDEDQVDVFFAVTGIYRDPHMMACAHRIGQKSEVTH